MKENVNLAIKWLFGISVLLIVLSFLYPIIQMAVTNGSQAYNCTLEPVTVNSQTCKQGPVVLEHKIVTDSGSECCKNKTDTKSCMPLCFFVLGVVGVIAAVVLAIIIFKDESDQRIDNLKEEIKNEVENKIKDEISKKIQQDKESLRNMQKHEEILSLIKAVGKIAENSTCNISYSDNLKSFENIIGTLKGMIE